MPHIRRGLRRALFYALRNAMLLVFLVGLAAWIVILVIRDVKEDSSTVAKQPLSAAAVASGPNDLRIDAWIDDSRVVAGDRITYWFTVTNTSTIAVTDVSIVRSAFRHPYLTETRGMTNEPFGLKPGQVATFEGELMATDHPGTYGIGAVVSWNEVARDGRIARRKPIRIGPVTIENPTTRRRLRSLHVLEGVVKDVAMPVALAIIAYFFTSAENKREASRRTREAAQQRHERFIEEEREKNRQAAAESTTRLHQTWTLMLPKVHEYTETYYMPATTNAFAVTRYYDGEQADREYCFFFYLLYLSQMKQLVDAIKGFYLRYRIGENTVALLWELILMVADARFTRPRREAAQLLVDAKWTFAEYTQHLGTDALILDMKREFMDAYDAFSADVALLRLFAIILEYEANTSYEFWYEPEKLDEEQWVQAYGVLLQRRMVFAAAKSERKFDTLLRTLDEHHAGVPARAS